MSTFAKVFAGIAVLVIGLLVGLYAINTFTPEPPVIVTDKLCQFVKNEQQMGCVAVLAADTYMKPGAIVEVQPAGFGRVSLPVADLMAEQCRVPGANLTALQAGMLKQQSISVPQFSYEVNRALQIGGDVEIPQFSDFKFKAGPKWSNVSKIDLTVDESWVTQLDELAIINAFGSCHIRKRCTDYVKSQNYRVVGSAVTGRGLSYHVYNKNGQLLSLETGAKSGEFTASVGGSTEIGSSADATIKAKDARVYGVRLIPLNAFDGKQSCDQSVAFEPPSAQAIVTIVGGGGKGSIGSLQSQEKPIGETAALSADGTEESECDGGFERKRSGASAKARVVEESPGALRFNYDVKASGGHYVTAAACVGDTVMGKTGHDTSGTATADLKATVFVLLRSESSPALTVAYADMPPEAKIQMYDYQSRRLQIARRETFNGDTVIRRSDTPASVSGNGSVTVETHGPGLYRVEVSFRLNASVTGNVDATTQQQSASVKVTVAP